MIRAVIKREGGPDLVVLGLSAANLEKLKRGDPVHVEGAEINQPNDVVVMYGETEAVIAAELREAGVPIPQVGNPKRGQRRRLV